MRHAPSSRPRAERGVVLIIVMVMLVIIGLASAASMRNALSSDAVANSTRVQLQATEAAQIALRWCEQQVVAGNVAVVPLQQPPAAGASAPTNWEDIGAWNPGASRRAQAVPAAFIQSATNTSGTTQTLSGWRAPECMAECRRLDTAEGAISAATSAGCNNTGQHEAVIVTARGFSPDYAEDAATGRQLSGSAMWVQSINRF